MFSAGCPCQPYSPEGRAYLPGLEVLGFQPQDLTEENTEYELDPLGTVESQVSITYEEDPDLRSFLFRATQHEELLLGTSFKLA